MRQYLPVVGDVVNPTKQEAIYASRLAYVHERKRRCSLPAQQENISIHPRWDGGYSDGKPKKSYWIGIAEFMLRHKLNPHATYETFFREKGLWGPPPPPALVCTTTLLPEYEEATANINTIVRNQLKADTGFATTRIIVQQSLGSDKRSSVLFVLAQEHLPISPLLRYSLAVSEGVPEFALRFRDAALKQFCRYPAEYARVWEDVLPLELAAMTVEDRVALLRKFNQ